MPDAALAHHRMLSEWFEHVRAFLKIEWHPDPLAACYFRRRPPVDDVVTRLSRLGVGPEARELAIDVAGRLEKDTIHFVAAAFRPQRAVYHKLYFSQWVTPETREKVAARIGRVFDLFGAPEELKGLWRKNHERCVPIEESTIFLSVSFSADGVVPSFKIDYPSVGAARAALWLPAEQQAQVIEDAEAACALAGTSAVTYLGVRFCASERLPSLKYYCDVPDAR